VEATELSGGHGSGPTGARLDLVGRAASRSSDGRDWDPRGLRNWMGSDAAVIKPIDATGAVSGARHTTSMWPDQTEGLAVGERPGDENRISPRRASNGEAARTAWQRR